MTFFNIEIFEWMGFVGDLQVIMKKVIYSMNQVVSWQIAFYFWECIFTNKILIYAYTYCFLCKCMLVFKIFASSAKEEQRNQIAIFSFTLWEEEENDFYRCLQTESLSRSRDVFWCFQWWLKEPDFGDSAKLCEIFLPWWKWYNTHVVTEAQILYVEMIF